MPLAKPDEVMRFAEVRKSFAKSGHPLIAQSEGVINEPDILNTRVLLQSQSYFGFNILNAPQSQEFCVPAFKAERAAEGTPARRQYRQVVSSGAF